MKKFIFLIVVLVTLSFFLSACSNAGSSSSFADESSTSAASQNSVNANYVWEKQWENGTTEYEYIIAMTDEAAIEYVENKFFYPGVIGFEWHNISELGPSEPNGFYMLFVVWRNYDYFVETYGLTETKNFIIVPQDVVESYLMELFDVDKAKIRQSRLYNPVTKTYDYYTEGGFGSPYAAITKLAFKTDKIEVCYDYKNDSGAVVPMVLTLTLSVHGTMQITSNTII